MLLQAGDVEVNPGPEVSRKELKYKGRHRMASSGENRQEESRNGTKFLLEILPSSSLKLVQKACQGRILCKSKSMDNMRSYIILMTTTNIDNLREKISDSPEALCLHGIEKIMIPDTPNVHPTCTTDLIFLKHYAIDLYQKGTDLSASLDKLKDEGAQRELVKSLATIPTTLAVHNPIHEQWYATFLEEFVSQRNTIASAQLQITMLQNEQKALSKNIQQQNNKDVTQEKVLDHFVHEKQSKETAIEMLRDDSELTQKELKLMKSTIKELESKVQKLENESEKFAQNYSTLTNRGGGDDTGDYVAEALKQDELATTEQHDNNKLNSHVINELKANHGCRKSHNNMVGEVPKFSEESESNLKVIESISTEEKSHGILLEKEQHGSNRMNSQVTNILKANHESGNSSHNMAGETSQFASKSLNVLGTEEQPDQNQLNSHVRNILTAEHEGGKNDNTTIEKTTGRFLEKSVNNQYESIETEQFQNGGPVNVQQPIMALGRKETNSKCSIKFSKRSCGKEYDMTPVTRKIHGGSNCVRYRIKQYEKHSRNMTASSSVSPGKVQSTAREDRNSKRKPSEVKSLSNVHSNLESSSSNDDDSIAESLGNKESKDLPTSGKNKVTSKRKRWILKIKKKRGSDRSITNEVDNSSEPPNGRERWKRIDDQEIVNKVATTKHRGESLRKAKSYMDVSQHNMETDYIDTALERVAGDIGEDWKRLCRILGVKDSDLQSVDHHEKSFYEKAYKGLQKWKQTNGSKATLGKLHQALEESGRKDLADKYFQSSSMMDSQQLGQGVSTTDIDNTVGGVECTTQRRRRPGLFKRIRQRLSRKTSTRWNSTDNSA